MNVKKNTKVTSTSANLSVADDCTVVHAAVIPQQQFLGHAIEQLGQDSSHLANRKNVCCESCGTTLEEFIVHVGLNCDNCLKTFASEIQYLLGKISKYNRHIGKRPDKIFATANSSLHCNLNDNVAQQLNADVVISSRVRLARNFAGYRFPGKATSAEKRQLLNKMCEICVSEPNLQLQFIALEELTTLQRQTLLEQRIISRNHAECPDGRGVMLSRDGQLSIMVNEEDHLRIQGIQSGFNLALAFNQAHTADTLLARFAGYAFDEQLGYVTTCPTNMGTGMRLSVMMHLPALVLENKTAAIFAEAVAQGITVRGLYGESSDADGNLFQLSNRDKLGVEEHQQLAVFTEFVRTVIELEGNARRRIINSTAALKIINNAWHQLRTLNTISWKTALNLISLSRLGYSAGFVDSKPNCNFFELMQILNREVLLSGGHDNFSEDELRSCAINGRVFAKM